MDIEQIKEEMHAAAKAAAQDYLQIHYSGRDHGACGFAWIVLPVQHDGRTREGKAERKRIASLGADHHWDGSSFMIWNPAEVGAQNVDCKEAGARAGAEVLKKHGFEAYARSRLD